MYTILGFTFVQLFLCLLISAQSPTNYTMQLPGSPSLLVMFTINPTALPLDRQAAARVFMKAYTDISSSKDGFQMAQLPFTLQYTDPNAPSTSIALNFGYPEKPTDQISWSLLYQLFMTCSSFFTVQPEAAKEVAFQIISGKDLERASWGQGTITVVPPKVGRLRRRR